MSSSHEDKLKCSTCQDRLRDTLHFPCGHIICKDCLYHAVQAQAIYRRLNVECSVCKKDLPTADHTNITVGVAERSTTNVSSEVGDQNTSQQRFSGPSPNHYTPAPQPRPQSARSSQAKRSDDVGEAKARANKILLFVRMYDGKTLTVRARTTVTVATLMQKITELTGIPSHEQRPIYGGSPLNNSTATLGSYGIGDMCTIYMFPIVRGC